MRPLQQPSGRKQSRKLRRRCWQQRRRMWRRRRPLLRQQRRTRQTWRRPWRRRRQQGRWTAQVLARLLPTLQPSPPQRRCRTLLLPLLCMHLQVAEAPPRASVGCYIYHDAPRRLERRSPLRRAQHLLLLAAQRQPAPAALHRLPAAQVQSRRGDRDLGEACLSSLSVRLRPRSDFLCRPRTLLLRQASRHRAPCRSRYRSMQWSLRRHRSLLTHTRQTLHQRPPQRPRRRRPSIWSTRAQMRLLAVLRVQMRCLAPRLGQMSSVENLWRR